MNLLVGRIIQIFNSVEVGVENQTSNSKPIRIRSDVEVGVSLFLSWWVGGQVAEKNEINAILNSVEVVVEGVVEVVVELGNKKKE